MKFARVLSAAVMIAAAACADVTAPPAIGGTAVAQQGQRVVYDVAQFRQALIDNVGHIRVGAPIYFHSPADYLDICQLYTASNGLVISGDGGLFNNTGSFIYRMFDDPAGGFMLSCSRGSRDWELRIYGLIFFGNYKQGGGLRVEYSQQSIYEDLRFEGFDGVPFDISASGSSFDWIQVFYNAQPAVIRDANVTTIDHLTQLTAWATKWRGDVDVLAPPHTPWPAGNSYATGLRILAVHNEGSTLRIKGWHRAHYEGLYHLAGDVYLEATYPTWGRSAAWENWSRFFVNDELVTP
jgi:hypothetical protein